MPEEKGLQQGEATVSDFRRRRTGRDEEEGRSEMSTDDSGGWAQQWWRRASQRFSQGSSSLDRRRTVAGVEFTTRWTTGYEYLESVTDFFSTCLDKMNAWGERSWIGRFFTFRERQARLGKELHAGLISFLMVVYTLTVNPQILSTTGGTCDAATLCEPELYRLLEQDCLGVSGNQEAVDCLLNFKRSVTTATAVASLISCFLMGFFANLPLGLAPGIGINVYFAYQVVGQNVLTYEQALVAVFLEGWIFIVLSLTGVRGAVMKYMPTSIAFSGSVGMGLLLAYTGLRSLGVIAFDGTTLTTLGGCSGQNVQYVYYSNVSLANLTASVSSNLTSVETTEEFPVLATDMEGNVNDTMLNFSSLLFEQSSRTVFGCNGGEMRSATMWLGIAGGILSSLLLVWRVKGALFWGVLFVTVISWIPGHGASYLGAGSSIPGGQYRLENFEHVVAVPTLSSSGLKWDWSAIGNGHFWFVLFTFLYIDVLDCTGILLSMALLLDTSLEMDYYGVLDHEEIKAKKEAIKEANNGIEPNPYQQFVTTHSKEFKGQQWAFLSDGIGIVVSSMVGISPVSVYLESAAGIEEGGRTGIVPLVVSFFFFIALFFSPILSSIPSYATGSALMLVGIMLMAHADHIPWDDPKESIPAFITIMIMPLTYSVAYGILAGLCMYIILRLPEWVLELFRRARHKLREFRGEPSTDDNVSIASSKKSRGRGHAPRKVFGNLSNRGSDSYSNLGVSTDVFGRDRLTTGVSEVIPIPGGSRQLAHSQSHAAFSPSWDMRFGGLRGVGSSSPGGGSLLAGEESPSTVRRSWGRTMSGTEAMPMPVPPRSRPTGMQFPALRSSLKKSASFAVLDQSENLGTSDASMDGEAGGLFNNFQMLDLDLGGSGSSEDEDEIMVKNDGTLGLVSRKSLQLQRQSADMTMFNSSREGTNDMEPIAEPPDVGQVAHVSDSNEGSMHAARRITFSMLEKQGHDNEATLGAVDATAPQNTVSRTASLSRQATNQSMGSNTSAASSSGLGGLSRSLTQSASFPASRGMVRTESAAALRLKDLFAAAQANDDSGSSDE